MSKIFKMICKKKLSHFLGLALLVLPCVADSTVVADTKAIGSRPLPMVMDGFCEFTKYHLNDPVTKAPLTSRFIEIVVVNGEVDPPYQLVDDRIQQVNLEMNSDHHRSFLATTPGLIDAMVTVFVAKQITDDEKVQIWESILLRVFNDDDKAKATHYIDTAVHEAQGGFYEMRSSISPFGEWKEIKN